MNTLKIELNPYKDENMASLNGKALSSYSELSNYLKEPFLKWAGNLLAAAEREINDDFELVVIAEDFEKLFLHDMQDNFDSCLNYEAHSFAISFSVDDRFALACNLVNKHEVSITVDKYLLPTYCDSEITLNNELLEHKALNDAMLVVTKRMSLLEQIKHSSHAMIVVSPSDKSCVSCFGDQKYLWEIEEDRLEDVVRCISNRFVKIPYIAGVVTEMNKLGTTLEEQDAVTLSLLMEIAPLVFVSDIEDIEVGHTIPLEVTVMPKVQQIPVLRVLTTNQNVLSVDGTNLVGVGPGIADIEIYKENEILPFTKKRVRVLKNYFVQQISLEAKNCKMATGSKQQIKISVVPEDAEDAQKINWEISDPSIAEIDSSGNITSLAAGSIVVTASTCKTKSSITLEVLPDVSQIQLSMTDAKLYVGQVQPISISVFPKNCFDCSCRWLSSDSSVAIIDRLDDGSEIIRATGIGECILTCTANNGNCSERCSVTVEASFKNRERTHGMLSVTLLFAVLSLISGVFSFSLGTLGGAVAAVFCGLAAIRKHKTDSFWALLIMGVAVVVALVSVGLI